MTDRSADGSEGQDDLDERLERLLARVERLERENAALRSARRPPAVTPDPVSRRTVLRRAGSAAAAGAGAVAGLALLGSPALAADPPMILGGLNDSGVEVTKVTSTNPEVTLIVENDDVGTGIFVQTQEGTALQARATAPQKASVHGIKTSTGNAVIGEIDAPDSHWGAVAGSTNGHGPAVIGENNGDGYGAQGRALGSGDGIFGESTLGRGGRFKGKKAQLKLEPSSAATHPASGQKGDLFVDASGRLWFCKGGTSWKQLA